ncbi:hypothetical protein BV898_19007 [Hypsibius exemplaris]|uniref:Receptor ligand binding region domain-containing protein n=1 Tax=Hypsibius exemplaris TaxID=2072580 RepID=A0A9X6NKX8_HYPEX|nr:hypothetical protein BV898_19007 [Hypsibius exemplaris]
MVLRIGLGAFLILILLRSGFSKAVHVITVMIGDNPSVSYVAQSPGYDVAFSRAVELFPDALRNVTRQTVYRPGAFSCSEAAEIMPFVAVEISSILDEHRFDFNILISSGCSLEVMTLGDFAREWNVPLLATSVLRNAATQSRVIICLLSTSPGLRDFMINAERLGMTEGDFPADSAFQSLLLVNNPIPNWAALSGVLQSIRNTSQVRYNKSLTNIEMLNDVTISAFEVMTILLKVVRDLPPLKMDMQNGITFRQLFLNRTFNPLSRPVYIGPKGMRICDVHISKFNVTSGLMEVSDEYLSVAGNSVRTYALSTVWRGRDGPPVNRPFCGYTGELFLGGLVKTAVITLAVSISTALLATLAIFIAMYHCILGSSDHGAGRPWWDLQPDLLFVIPKTTNFRDLTAC